MDKEIYFIEGRSRRDNKKINESRLYEKNKLLTEIHFTFILASVASR